MQHWLLVVLLSVCFLLLAVLFWVLSHWKRPTLASSRVPQIRAYMLRGLRVLYGQLLETTLQDTVCVDLRLVSRPAAIQNAVSLELRLPAQPDHLLPAMNTIADAYEQAGQELLILGEPGTGKTTLMLELARHLVVQAEQDEMQPIPLWIPLASWAARHLPLQEWLIEQIKGLYNVPQWVSRQLVETGHILPLLDGLDEMEESARPACIAAINTYHREHVHPLVVSSRTDEYGAAARHERFVLHAAVVVQPLTPKQIDAYLATSGKPLRALRSALKHNSTFQTLATTPLLLHILVLTYHGSTIRMHSHNEAQLREHIWTEYVQRMVERKGDGKHYPPARTVFWLNWLARYLRASNQTIFFLEQLSLNLVARKQRLLSMWSVGLLVGLLVGPSIGLLAGLSMRLLAGPSSGLFYGLDVGIVGLVFGLLVGFSTETKIVEMLVWSWDDFFAALDRSKRDGILIGWLFAPLFALSGKQLSNRLQLAPNEGIQRSLKHGLFLLTVGLAFWLLVGSLIWRGSGLLFGLVFCLFIGLIYGLLAGMFLGLGTALRHYTLRFWLWRTHTFPLNAVAFLEDATKRNLLRRVGGGYSFTHRLLLDYFADLDTTTSSASIANPSPPQTL